jgi:hypothetical protein
MTVIDSIAKELQMSTNDLLRESLKTYLEQKIAILEADIFRIAKKYGIKNVFEIDAKIKEGLIKEKDAYEDYFTLDNLEVEREKLKKFAESL